MASSASICQLTPQVFSLARRFSSSAFSLLSPTTRRIPPQNVNGAARRAGWDVAVDGAAEPGRGIGGVREVLEEAESRV